MVKNAQTRHEVLHAPRDGEAHPHLPELTHRHFGHRQALRRFPPTGSARTPARFPSVGGSKRYVARRSSRALQVAFQHVLWSAPPAPAFLYASRGRSYTGGAPLPDCARRTTPCVRARRRPASCPNTSSGTPRPPPPAPRPQSGSPAPNGPPPQTPDARTSPNCTASPAYPETAPPPKSPQSRQSEDAISRRLIPRIAPFRKMFSRPVSFRVEARPHFQQTAHPPVQVNLPGGGFGNAGQDFQEGGLARPVPADDAPPRPLCGCQRRRL